MNIKDIYDQKWNFKDKYLIRKYFENFQKIKDIYYQKGNIKDIYLIRKYSEKNQK